MVIENSFKLVGGLLEELRPLGLEELVALSNDGMRMLFLELLCDGDSLMELGIIDHASYGYFSAHFVYFYKEWNWDWL